MVVLPLVLALVWIAVESAQRSSRGEPLVWMPATAWGWAALASVVLIGVVAATGAFLAATVPVGVAMLGLWAAARLWRHDRALLLALPAAVGLAVLVLPLVFE